ncbi:MAG: hypothetical protein LBV04_04360 [Deferribacteraceae bacterium]|jgi:hypothetical protein|nr:hypothetical protein [Deferribacteraceae bacterium]
MYKNLIALFPEFNHGGAIPTQLSVGIFLSSDIDLGAYKSALISKGFKEDDYG